ncbi:set domain-containing [Trichoderma cornu-damae]|uniref:Set domain-containing n=1 Tax=Trichoderma cornu-damae TaxID=654480 RepID=A0A9P8TUY7_9HYPO|nr:set domain-containing [Trichoderma cornu-damae]
MYEYETTSSNTAKAAKAEQGTGLDAEANAEANAETPAIAGAALVPPPTLKTSPSPAYSNDCFRIAESGIAGWGAFATRNLTKGDVILREIPLFVAGDDGIFDEFYKLDKDAADLAGLFPIAARFNHACHPQNNVDYCFDRGSNALTMVVREDTAAGQELTISYGKHLSPQLLYLCYGFRCRCGCCKGLSDEEMAIFATQW